VKLEADILDHLACIQVVNLQYDRSIVRNKALLFRLLVNDTADHHLDDIVLRAVLGDQGSDVSTVSHDCDAVRDDLDFIHTMGDVNDSHVLLAKVADDGKQIINFLFRKCCGRLIENNNLAFVGNGFRNFAHLLLANCQVAHFLGRIDFNMKTVKQLLGFLYHFPVIDLDAAHELTSDKNVLGNRQISDHVQLLMHDDDSGILSFSGVVEFHFFSFINDLAGILGINSRQDLHQC